jgi:hypothetical protein
MTDQIRSADLLVTKALADPETMEELKTKPKETLLKLSNEVVHQLPARPLDPPDAQTNREIWRVIVWAFAIVLVGAAAVLGVGVFVPKGDKVTTDSGTMLTVFTTVVGFLAGLLSPSPLASK